ncbi:MAG: flippase-like domain-containing protein [Polyangiaceae bacterium]|nr:flippase-like domain-containing protein [Polyangiaceae bacterium]MCW5790239.1 flippase-like domain-containing protein [Polyangiaceae bacterium]
MAPTTPETDAPPSATGARALDANAPDASDASPDALARDPDALSTLGTEPTPPKPPLWRRVLPFLLGAALLGWVLRRTSFSELAGALEHTNHAAFFGFALVALLTNLALDCIATSYIYRRTVCPVSFREFFVIRGASYLPSMLNHNLGQAWLTYYLAKRYRAPLWRVAGATLLVYGTNLAGLVLLGVVALVMSDEPPAWLAPILGVSLTLGVLYAALLRFGQGLLERFQATRPLVEIGVSGHLLAILVRLPHVAALYLGTWLSFSFFGVWVPPADALAYIPLLMLVAALPLTPGGVGTRDATALSLLAPFAPLTFGTSAITAATLSWLLATHLIAALISPPLMRRASRLLGR